MKTVILTAAVLVSFFALGACGRDDYSDTKKDTPGTTRDTGSTRDSSATRNTSATGDTAKRSSTETAASERPAQGKSGGTTSTGTAEPTKTKETAASSATSQSTGGSKTSTAPNGRSTVASATRSDKDPTSPTKSQTIEGTLLKVEGDSYLVKDIAGKEVKLTADANTKKDGNLTIGDRIVARFEDPGVLTSIKKR
jgi:hypothetical protein